MIIKKKLKDVTPEEYKKWHDKNCPNIDCDTCLFKFLNCNPFVKNNWANHKDLYSKKFLNQEIEIKIDDILTRNEKKYLAAVIEPFRSEINYIRKVHGLNGSKWLYISFYGDDGFDLPYFDPLDTKYKGMVRDKKYTLEELDL